MDSDTPFATRAAYEDFDWDPEAERLHQIKLALAMTPAQRLRWLETTVAELQPWVGLARAAECAR
ncbi:MAG: hypothetical protein GY946_18870 [bacterium]|nr:hypothetical protein [bacterium]